MKLFGVHWSSNDNGEMLGLISQAAIQRKPIPYLLTLGGSLYVAVSEIRRRSPSTKIFHRQFYPWNGSSVQNYEPPSGWGKTNEAEGRAFARFYLGVLNTNLDAAIKKGNNVWHVGFNEPGLGGDDAGNHLIDWHYGYTDEMDAAGLWITAFNFPPGYPALPQDRPKDGWLFWTNQRVHDYIRYLYNLGGMINLHEGDIEGSKTFRGIFTSRRHDLIRKLLPTDIRNVIIASTEYYLDLSKLAVMDAATFRAALIDGQDALKNDNVWPMLWVYKASRGYEGDDFYNKFGAYRDFILT